MPAHVTADGTVYANDLGECGFDTPKTSAAKRQLLQCHVLSLLIY